jgi:hypothetical protein
LADKNDGSMPLIFEGHEGAGGADEASEVAIMAAGMHDRDGLPLRVPGDCLTGIGQTGLFLDRQPVHVRADQDHWAGTVCKYGDNPVIANATGDFVAGLGEFVGQARGGFLLLKRKLRMRMKVFINGK